MRVAGMVLAAAVWVPAVLCALEDPGRAKIGAVQVDVLFGTDGDPAVAGEGARAVSPGLAKRLAREEALRFRQYRVLGSDRKPLLRSYESWAEPFESEEVLVRFEAQGKPTKRSAVLDLEVWLSRKKAVKSVVELEADRPVFVLGPEWRGGRLIISIGLAREAGSGP
jgi:hypothetical protein